MGLIIEVKKLKKATKEDIENESYFELDNDDLQNFPKWVQDLVTKETEDWFDWNKFGSDKNINIDEWSLIREDCVNNNSMLFFRNEKTREEFSVAKKDIPIFKHEIPIIGYDNIGKLSLGMNEPFFLDKEYFVWTKEEVERSIKKYCNSEKDKKLFKKNILNNFIEGKCCVSFF